MTKSPMSGARGRINSAQSDVHAGREAKSKINVGSAGSERPTSPKGVQEGGSAGEAAGNPLSHAIGHLRAQHPIPYHDLGPHHGTNHHDRHHPVTGGVYGRAKRDSGG